MIGSIYFFEAFACQIWPLRGQNDVRAALSGLYPDLYEAQIAYL